MNVNKLFTEACKMKAELERLKGELEKKNEELMQYLAHDGAFFCTDLGVVRRMPGRKNVKWICNDKTKKQVQDSYENLLKEKGLIITTTGESFLEYKLGRKA
jgi:hypothetical protein